MDSIFKLIDSNLKGMAGISIFEDGKKAHNNAFGFASKKDNSRVTDKIKYRIGSISKTFTASIIMKLIAKGKLSLTPNFRNFTRKSTRHK